MSKSDKSDLHANQFKALSNPHRLALFKRLMPCCVPGTVCNSDEATRICVGDLGEGLNIVASTLSHHLKELNRAGLIQMQRQGKTIQCWVEPKVLTELASFFAFTESK
jgi:ArsR family transcriptional regulator